MDRHTQPIRRILIPRVAVLCPVMLRSHYGQALASMPTSVTAVSVFLPQTSYSSD